MEMLMKIIKKPLYENDKKKKSKENILVKFKQFLNDQENI